LITLTLPWPVSTNNLFMNAGKRRVITKAYAAWRTLAGKALDDQRPTPLTGPFSMALTLFRPDRIRRDCTNFIKAPEDLLVAHGVVTDDSLAQRVTVEWSNLPPAKPGRVRITLEAA